MAKGLKLSKLKLKDKIGMYCVASSGKRELCWLGMVLL